MSNKAKIREEARALNPIDDVFFQVMAEDKMVCQEILRTILGDPELEVVKVTPQRELRNLQGRSVWLDTECILGSREHTNVEVQKSDNDDHQRRVRYNASCLTVNISDTGIKFKNVPDVVMVYITRFDLFGGGKTSYHIDRSVRELGRQVYNGLTEIYVNAEVDDGSDIAELMRVFVQDDCYDDEKFPHISRQKRYLKTEQKGVGSMAGVMERLLKEERQAGRKEGRASGQKEGIRIGEVRVLAQLIKDGILSPANAAARASMSEKEFQELLSRYTDQ